MPINWEYEKEEREMLFSLAKDGDTFFDIGANAGLYSISFAQRFPNSSVYAFEPIPDTVEELRKNIRHNQVNGITICHYGLSDTFATAKFYFPPSDSGANAMFPIGDGFGPTITVQAWVYPLDHLCSDKFGPNIIKCDVEGAELLVLKGGYRTIEKYKPIIQCEMLRKWAKRFNYHPNDIIDFLGQYGYHCFTLRDGKLERFETMTEDTIETNFFFIHPERLA